MRSTSTILNLNSNSATRVLRLSLLAAAVLVILALTLSPPQPGYFKAFAFCIACSRRWLADGMLNIWLFVPLGLVVGLNERPFRSALLWGAALSAGIELAQMFMPGRTSALNDIVFNTIGAVAGAGIASSARSWLRPADKASRTLLASSLFGATLVATATLVLLSPIKSPLIPERVGVRLPASPTTRPGEIVAIIDVDIPSSDERFYFGRERDDFLIRYPTIASMHGLDQPEYWLPRGTTGATVSDSMLVSLKRDASRWVMSAGYEAPVTLGPTIGQGWTLLAYPEAIGRRWGALLNSIWAAGLFAPVAFWARRRLRIVAAAAVTLLLIFIPFLTGTATTSRAEWAGAGLGFLLGLMGRQLVHSTSSRGSLEMSLPPTSTQRTSSSTHLDIRP